MPFCLRSVLKRFCLPPLDTEQRARRATARARTAIPTTRSTRAVLVSRSFEMISVARSPDTGRRIA
eukprot:24566-Pelagococcus_subviridis.AAC.19